MEKTYLILSCHKSVLTNPSGNAGLVNGNCYTGIWFNSEELARLRADDMARAGNVAIIYESTEYRQAKPIPVVVETVYTSS